MAIEIVDFPIKNGDVPLLCIKSPEGRHIIQDGELVLLDCWENDDNGWCLSPIELITEQKMLAKRLKTQLWGFVKDITDFVSKHPIVGCLRAFLVSTHFFHVCSLNHCFSWLDSSLLIYLPVFSLFLLSKKNGWLTSPILLWNFQIITFADIYLYISMQHIATYVTYINTQM